MSFLLWKVGKFVGMVIVGMMVLVAMLPDGDARSLGVTGAEVGGKSTDIVITDMIPAFFSQISSSDSTAS